MAITTIAVDSSVRDRIETAAERRGLTAGVFVELLLEAWLREERLTAIRQAMEQATRDAAEPGTATGVEIGVEDGITAR